MMVSASAVGTSIQASSATAKAITQATGPFWWHWLALVGSIITEVTCSYLFKQSHGFTNMASSVGSFAVSNLNAACTIIALSGLTLSSAWSIYTAFEYAGALLVGFTLFGESLSVAKLVGILLCVSGTVVLVLEEEGALPSSWSTPLAGGWKVLDEP